MIFIFFLLNCSQNAGNGISKPEKIENCLWLYALGSPQKVGCAPEWLVGSYASDMMLI